MVFSSSIFKPRLRPKDIQSMILCSSLARSSTSGTGCNKNNVSRTWFRFAEVEYVIILTNSEASVVWSFTSSRVGDYTLIIACIACLDLLHSKHAALSREVLPLIFPKWFPLPLVVQWLCSSRFYRECNILPWKNVILADWLGCNFGRFGCKSGWKCFFHCVQYIVTSYLLVVV